MAAPDKQPETEKPSEWSLRGGGFEYCVIAPIRTEDHNVDYLESIFKLIIQQMRRHQIVTDDTFDPIALGC